MYHSVRATLGSGVATSDGLLGTLNDLLFDDRTWIVRYLVVDANPSVGRSVLIAPAAVVEPAWTDQIVWLMPAIERIRKSPPVDPGQIVTPHASAALSAHYGWPALEQHRPLRHLRSLFGHRAEASDGSIGTVEDCVLYAGDWVIPRLVVDSRCWMSGMKILLSPTAIERIGWEDRVVQVALTRNEVRASPACRVSAREGELVRAIWQRGAPGARPVESTC